MDLIVATSETSNISNFKLNFVTRGNNVGKLGTSAPISFYELKYIIRTFELSWITA